MPNRTIYLPDDVDRLVDELDVNLSQVTQQAIRALATERAVGRDQRLLELKRRVRKLDLSYPADHLRGMRREAGDDLR
jgi:hypothetical protein